MKIIGIYVANNGDVFFEHDCMYQELSEKEIAELIEMANKAYEELSVPAYICKSKEINKIVQAITYSLPDGTFLGEAGMHITDGFSPFQNFMYITRKSKQTESNKLCYAVTHDIIPITEYAKLKGVKPDTVRQKILRGNLNAVKIGRDWMIDRNEPYKKYK